MIHTNAGDAIRAGNGEASSNGKPHGIAYVQGKGWQCYDFSAPCPGQPEFVCWGLGRHPFPLSEVALSVFMSVIRAGGKAP